MITRLAHRLSPHQRAVLQALFVSFLWSTSWIFIKIGLDDIPALTFAGLRYALAAVCLLVLAAQSGQLTILRTLGPSDRRQLVVLGLLFYTATQGAQFLALDRLPAMTLSLILSAGPVLVALLGIALLDERLTRTQWAGIGLYLFGAVVFFYPVPGGQTAGILIGIGGALAYSFASIVGRDINRARTLPPLLITAASMGVGAAVLLVAGIAAEGFPALSAQSIGIIVWLAIVNTAFAFTLWNHTLRTLPAAESSILNNTMTIQIAVLAWVFLGESLTAREIVGLVLAGIGVLVVQVRRVGANRITEKR